MKRLILFLFVLYTTAANAQKKYALYIDSVCKIIDADVSSALSIKVKSRNTNVREWQRFQIDTLQHRFIKVNTQIQDNSIARNYYFYDNKLIRVDVLNYQMSKPSNRSSLYFKDKQIVYSSHKQKSPTPTVNALKIADEMLDYVEFVKSQR